MINQTNGNVEGCHPTKARAVKQQRALYANVPHARHAVNAVTLSTEIRGTSLRAERVYLKPLLAAYQRAIRGAGRSASEAFAITAAADWQPPAEGAVLTAAKLAEINDALRRSLVPLWRRVLLDIAAGPLGRIGISWDVKHPLVVGQIEKAAQRTGERLGEAVQPVLRKVIEDAYEQGLAVRETAALIRREIAAAAPWQAEMLARTDLNSLANGASKAAASLTGMQFKTWVATLDEKTRPEHADAHGQTVPINDPFDVGGEDLDYPGDPAGSDANVCNCRCTLAYGESLAEAQALLADGGNTMAKMTHRQRVKRNARLAAQKRVTKKTPAVVPSVDLAKLNPEEGAELIGLLEKAAPDTLGAVAVHHTAVASGTWDGNAAMGRASSAADYRSICAWFEGGADLSERQSWKFPHHASPGGPANINGVRNGLARLSQASIPAGDKAGVEAHLRAHLNDFNRKQESNAIAGLDAMSVEDALAAVDDAWGLTELSTEDELAAAMPSGMDTLPDGISHCTLGGKPGFSGGGLCRVHDGTDAGMQKAVKAAQADARSRAKHAVLASARPVAFSGTAAIEGKISDDNTIAPRVLLADSLSWPEMPVPFMAQTVTAQGHDGAEVSGRVDEFARKRGRGKMREITFSGELTTPFGINEIAPMIEDKTLRYVSVDLGASEWSVVDRKTLDLVPQEEFDFERVSEGIYALGLTSGKIKAVTLVPTQALEGAMVALTAAADRAGIAIEALEDDEFRIIVPIDALALAGQALTAAAAPAQPPAEWFATPEPPGKMPLTISEDGRVFGHLATWDSCHVGFLPNCVPPPKSDSSYAYFHVCELDTAEGETVTVGKLMFSPTDGGHADRSLSAAKASAHYDKTGMAAAYLRVTDGDHGIWAAGSLNPSLSDEQRQEMRRQLRLHPPSGDWRPINGQYELICALAVAVPGYPTPRATITVTASAEGIELEEAIIASSGVIEPDPEAIDALEQIGLVDEELRAEREMGELAARASWRDKLREIVGG